MHVLTRYFHDHNSLIQLKEGTIAICVGIIIDSLYTRSLRGATASIMNDDGQSITF